MRSFGWRARHAELGLRLGGYEPAHAAVELIRPGAFRCPPCLRMGLDLREADLEAVGVYGRALV